MYEMNQYQVAGLVMKRDKSHLAGPETKRDMSDFVKNELSLGLKCIYVSLHPVKISCQKAC